jgi:hypothetical protein
MASSEAEDRTNWSNRLGVNKDQKPIGDGHLLASTAGPELQNHPGSRFTDHGESQVSLIPLAERHHLGTISTR